MDTDDCRRRYTELTCNAFTGGEPRTCAYCVFHCVCDSRQLCLNVSVRVCAHTRHSPPPHTCTEKARDTCDNSAGFPAPNSAPAPAAKGSSRDMIAIEQIPPKGFGHKKTKAKPFGQVG
jgi:hypothetical protein